MRVILKQYNSFLILKIFKTIQLGHAYYWVD